MEITYYSRFEDGMDHRVQGDKRREMSIEIYKIVNQGNRRSLRDKKSEKNVR